MENQENKKIEFLGFTINEGSSVKHETFLNSDRRTKTTEPDLRPFHERTAFIKNGNNYNTTITACRIFPMSNGTIKITSTNIVTLHSQTGTLFEPMVNQESIHAICEVLKTADERIVEYCDITQILQEVKLGLTLPEYAKFALPLLNSSN